MGLNTEHDVVNEVAEVPADEFVSPHRVTTEEFRHAMRLLGLNPDDNERVLVKVVIEEGRITATYAQINHCGKAP